MIIMWEFYSVSVVPNMHSQYGSTGGGVFKRGGTKLERFLPKNQHTQRKLLNFENWVSGRCQKLAIILVSKVI